VRTRCFGERALDRCRIFQSLNHLKMPPAGRSISPLPWREVR
jgi:hypothetical protein